MDESAFKILIANLEGSRSVLDGWLNLWTALVVIGVVAEIGFVIWEYTDDLRAWRSGAITSPARPRRVKFLLELVGASLVALGVAGELVVDARIGYVEAQLKTVNDERVLLLQREAGDAKRSATDAATAAKSAVMQSE